MVVYTVIDIDTTLKSDLGQLYTVYLLQVLPQKVVIAIFALTIIYAFSIGQDYIVYWRVLNI